MSGWQPIETAPKDGRFIMLFVPNRQLETGPVTIGGYWPPDEPRDERGRFNKGGFAPANWKGWLGTDADLSPSWCDPTHWMPLPAPPSNDDRTDRPAAQPSPETTLHADMLALIKDLQARGLTTTEDHERVMSIIERAEEVVSGERVGYVRSSFYGG